MQLVSVCVSVCVYLCARTCPGDLNTTLCFGRGVKKHWFIHSLAIFCCHRVMNEFAMLRQKSRTNVDSEYCWSAPHFALFSYALAVTFLLFVRHFMYLRNWRFALVYTNQIKLKNWISFQLPSCINSVTRNPNQILVTDRISCPFLNPLQTVKFTKKMLNTSFSSVCN